jgi:hypothetical protein
MPVIRSARVSQVVAPGEWILVPLTGDDPFPAEMEVGPVARKKCFLERDEQGNALAAMRCPALAPGRYAVKVWARGQTVETAIQVTG